MKPLQNRYAQVRKLSAKSIFVVVILSLLATVSSCTADDLETVNTDEKEVLVPVDDFQADGEADGEPKVIVTSPPKKS